LHRDLAAQFGQDPRVACLAFYSWQKWIVGKPNDSQVTSRDAITYSREFDHINTHAYADFFTLFELYFRDDVSTVEVQANALNALCKERRMAMWGEWASFFCAWVLGRRGGRRAAIEQMRGNLAASRESGQDFGRPFFLTMLAQTLASCGQINDGLDSLAEALLLVDGTDERWCEAEIHRQKGELLRSLAGSRDDEAEAEFIKSLEIARRQGALSLELRSATSLAKMLVDRGDRRMGFEVLAPVYARFTEGFDTPDLMKAKTVLDGAGA